LEAFHNILPIKQNESCYMKLTTIKHAPKKKSTQCNQLKFHQNDFKSLKVYVI